MKTKVPNVSSDLKCSVVNAKCFILNAISLQMNGSKEKVWECVTIVLRCAVVDVRNFKVNSSTAKMNGKKGKVWRFAMTAVFLKVNI